MSTPVAELIRHSLPIARGPSGRYHALKLAELYGISPHELALVVGREVSGLRKNPEGQGVQEALVPLVAIANLVLEQSQQNPEYLRWWLTSPLPVLGYRTPLSLLKEQRSEEVLTTLHSVLLGIPA